MSGYIVSIIVTTFLIALISFILPSGSTAKYVKSVLSMVLVVVIVSPLIKFSSQNFDVNNIFSSQNVYLQTDFLDYVLEEKVDNLSKNCNLVLENLGVKGANIEILYRQNEGIDIIIQKVTINLKNAVINSDLGHIDIIEKTKKSISEYLVLKESDVVIYE